MNRVKPIFNVGDPVESLAGMKGTVERFQIMAGDRSYGYHVRWENGSRSFARIGTVLKRPEFICSFCKVAHYDWKAHRQTALHLSKAEGVRRSLDTYQGEAEKVVEGES